MTDTLILFPTRREAAPFERLYGTRYPTAICGVGPVSAAVETARLLTATRPRNVILAGIAGAYPESGLRSGQVVSVATETLGGIGTMRNGRMLAMNAAGKLNAEDRHALCLPAGTPFPVVASRTACVAGAPLTVPPVEAIENMEGAAFAAACRALSERMPDGFGWYELRAVSNLTGDDFARWEIDRATEALAHALAELSDLLSRNDDRPRPISRP